MRTFAMISRHMPTDEQHALANQADIYIQWIGDMDAFGIEPSDISALKFNTDGVIVVHPAAALRLCGHYPVGIFENGSRPGPDDRPVFFARSLHIYDRTGLGIKSLEIYSNDPPLERREIDVPAGRVLSEDETATDTR